MRAERGFDSHTLQSSNKTNNNNKNNNNKNK